MSLSEELHLIDRYWRAANYLSVGQLYLYDNPMLREPLTLAHVKPLVVGLVEGGTRSAVAERIMHGRGL